MDLMLVITVNIMGKINEGKTKEKRLLLNVLQTELMSSEKK